MRPGEYSDGDATSTGGWLVGDTVYTENPRRLLTPADWAMVSIWAACRPGGLGGARLLPDPGGVLQQVGIMHDALRIMDDEGESLAGEGAPPAMIGLQVRMAISGTIDQYDQALAQTNTGAIRSAVNRIRSQGRRQIARAGLGRLQKAWRGIVYSEAGKNITRTGTALDPKGRVYSAAGVKGRVDDVLDVFERGVVIVPKAGQFLAIPTKAAPGGRRGKSAGEYPDGTFRAVPIQGGNGKGRGKRRPKRWVLVHKVTNTIWFILVPTVRLKKRLRLRPLVERIGQGVGADMDRRWARAVVRLEKAGH